MAQRGHRKEYDLHRLVMLSDGVFAIAMTLLALELKPPQTWDGSVAGLFYQMRGDLLAYGISFMAVSAYWLSHRRSFKHMLGADAPLAMLNLLSLGLVTLLPAVTRLMMEHGGLQATLYVYFGLITAIGVMNALVWAYAALRPGMMDPELGRLYRLIHFISLLAAPAIMFLLSWLAFSGAGPLLSIIAIVAMVVGLVALRRWAAGQKPARQVQPAAE